MCGIAGVVGGQTTGERPTNLAERMIATLAHRGPDGIRVQDAPDARLAHARLSIIDLESG